MQRLLGSPQGLTTALHCQMMDQSGLGATMSLGRKDEKPSVPCLVDDVLESGSTGATIDNINTCKGERGLKAVAVKAGGMMSLAIDQCGALWIWGYCPQPASESNDEAFHLSFIPSPQIVRGFQDHSVSKVSCGNEHVLALVNHGVTVSQEQLICYAWGSNAHGQLGLGDRESRLVPRPVVSLSHPVAGMPFNIACGAFHSAVLTSVQQQDGIGTGLEEAPKFNQMCLKGRGSICWTFGLGENGQLGHGSSESKLLPEPVDGLPNNALLRYVECGLFHTCVITTSRDVWVWGMERGLGLCPNIGPPGIGAGDALSPLKIAGEGSDGPLFVDPLGVACGAAHTVVVTDNGYKLWAWGRGQNGVLGRGNTLDSLVPCLVSWPPAGLIDIVNLKNGPKESEEKQMVDMTVKIEDKCTDEEGKAASDKFRLLDMAHRLSLAEEEMQFLRAKMTTVERYANILHLTIFGNSEYGHNIMQVIHRSNAVDVKEEWEKAMEAASQGELDQMEAFYRTMRTKVKDIILKKKIKEWTSECLNSFSSGPTNSGS
eukprot:Gb_19242 [translate_table: standard]